MTRGQQSGDFRRDLDPRLAFAVTLHPRQGDDDRLAVGALQRLQRHLRDLHVPDTQRHVQQFEVAHDALRFEEAGVLGIGAEEEPRT